MIILAVLSGQKASGSRSEATLEEMEPLEETVASAKRNEHEDLGLQEEPAYFNPLLRAALRGDMEEVQQIFEDLEDPDHEKANKLLMEKDIIGRNLLFPTCMVGQSDIIQSLARYGVDLKDKTARGYTLLHCAAAWGQLDTLKTLVELEADICATTFRGEKARDIANRYKQTECVEFLDWAGEAPTILVRTPPVRTVSIKTAVSLDYLRVESCVDSTLSTGNWTFVLIEGAKVYGNTKQNFRNFISQIQATVTDPEKVQGRLNKEDKTTSIKACQAKLDWLENTKDPTTQEFIDQKQQLEDIMLPIFIKLATPRKTDLSAGTN